MKVLLSSALMTVEDMFGQYSKGGGAYLPHGLLSIAGVLFKAGIDVRMCDPYVDELDKEKFIDFLQENNFDVIGLGNCYTAQVSKYYETASICKSALPDAKVCIGGAHPTIFPEETMRRSEDIDYLICGEGEYPFLELIKFIENGNKDISEIQGLIYKDNGEIKVNKPFPGIKNADDIPVFPYHLLNVEKYEPPPSNYKRLPTYGILVQRGCPYRCVFCDTRIHGKKLRQMSIDRTMAEIRHLIDNYGMRGVIFQDSVFTINRKWTVEFCNRLIEDKIDLTWTCYTRLDAVDEELLMLMKKAGCWSISYGIETANQKSLNLIRKSISLDKMISSINATKKAGIEVIGSIILCLPGEDEEMVKNTIAFVKKMELDIVVFFMPVPFPGTELYDICLKDGGLVDSIEWDDYKQWMDQKNPLYINPLLGKEKMLELYNYAFRTFYLSPAYIWKNLKRIKSFSDVKKYFKGFSSISGLIGRAIHSSLFQARE